MRQLLALALLLGLAPAARAGIVDLVADKAQSSFTWTGTTSLGPIVGDPSNAFQVDGHQQLTLAVSASGAKWDGRFLAGDLLVTPDIKGRIPNPIPLLPPLATIEINGLRLSLSSPTFKVQADGAWSTYVTAHVLAGQMVVTPLGGSPTVTSLAGSSSSPALQAGTLLPAGGDLHLASPVDLVFPFSDPASGVSGTLSTQGTLQADWSAPTPSVYCTAKTTSSGCTPTLSVSGTPSASASSGFTILASQVEAKNFGIFFFGTSGPASIPFQGGFLCVQSPVTRVAPQPAGGSAACSGAYSLDFNAWLAANRPDLRAPGESFYAQCWFRDPPDPVSGTGLTDAVWFVLAP
jgi:hypothetical protein